LFKHKNYIAYYKLLLKVNFKSMIGQQKTQKYLLFQIKILNLAAKRSSRADITAAFTSIHPAFSKAGNSASGTIPKPIVYYTIN